MNDRKRALVYAALTGVVAVSLIFAGYQMQEKNKYKTVLENKYSDSFHQAADYLQNVDNMLSKVRLAKQPQQNAAMFAEIWKQASEAHTNISQLPYNHEMISTSMKYLSQVSDVSYVMMKKSIEGHGLNPEDWEQIDELKNHVGYLSQEVNLVLAQSGLSGMLWDSIADEMPPSEDMVASDALLGSMATVYKHFQEYPELIYDGAFSDHIQNIHPRMTEGMPEVTREEAMETVKAVLRDFNIIDIGYMGTTDITVKSGVPVYSYMVTLEGEAEPSIWIDITRAGAYPLWMINNANIDFAENRLSPEQAVDKAQRFLSDIGFNSMKYSYYETYENTIFINFAAYQDGVLLYPDLVKVKLNLVDGTLLGFEALGYISMHTERELMQPPLTIEQARKFVSESLEITEVATVLIPTENKDEVLCYEFSGVYEGGNYKIYINASTGKMERILELIISDNGVLAQ